MRIVPRNCARALRHHRPEAKTHSDVVTPRYQRRRPERTVLNAVVREHLGDFLREARDHADRGLPRYVEKELTAYLDCRLIRLLAGAR